jgi:hypothetical protein
VIHAEPAEYPNIEHPTPFTHGIIISVFAGIYCPWLLPETMNEVVVFKMLPDFVTSKDAATLEITEM